MSLHYLLDTNILSEPLKKNPDDVVLSKIHIHQHEIATAALVLYELIRSAHRLPKSPKRTSILEYVENFIRVALPILPYDENAAIWHGTEVARLMNMGKPLSPIDSQIAAIAKTINRPLAK